MLSLEFFVAVCYNITMFIDLSRFNLDNKVVAVALSGGSDSVALFHYLKDNQTKYGYSLKAINVEHGIRGEQSKKDSFFVVQLCNKYNVPLLSYQVDAIDFAKNDKLSLEESARILRYRCFFFAISNGLCDLIATAHHQKDNAETVLFNIFRGAGANGLTGISDYDDKIIRPFINLPKKEIDQFILENGLEYVVDQSNFDQNYTRNYLRHTVLPAIEKVFPEVQNSISRLSNILSIENEYLDEQAKNSLVIKGSLVEISLPLHKALLNRAIIFALKSLGLKKDWEKVHVDDVCSLSEKENGKSINLPKNIVAIKEYDKITLYVKKEEETPILPVKQGEFAFAGKRFVIMPTTTTDYKKGLYISLDKLPPTAVIRAKKDGDLFTKFKGGTKSLSDFFTDKKIPLKDRNSIPLIADGNKVLAIFGIAVSENLKIEDGDKVLELISIKQ